MSKYSTVSYRTVPLVRGNSRGSSSFINCSLAGRLGWPGRCSAGHQRRATETCLREGTIETVFSAFPTYPNPGTACNQVFSPYVRVALMEPPGTDSADAHTQPLAAAEARGGTSAVSAQANTSASADARPSRSSLSGEESQQALVNAVAYASNPSSIPFAFGGHHTDAFAGISDNGWKYTRQVRFSPLGEKIILICGRVHNQKSTDHRSNSKELRSVMDWRKKNALTSGSFDSQEEAVAFALVSDASCVKVCIVQRTFY